LEENGPDKSPLHSAQRSAVKKKRLAEKEGSPPQKFASFQHGDDNDESMADIQTVLEKSFNATAKSESEASSEVNEGVSKMKS
jgi:hypothetical protein